MMRRALVLLLAGLASTGCVSSLPTPQYAVLKQPPPHRVGPDGLRIDNAGYRLDADGWRIDQRGRRLGVVPPKVSDPNDAVAGYWVAEQYQH
jgi:hypothetical protein